MPEVTVNALIEAVQRVFARRGVPDEEARIVAAHLVDAEACGVTSHGLLRVAQYAEALDSGRVSRSAALAVLSRSGCTARLDGGGGLGPVQTQAAMQFTCDLAARAGCAAVTLTNVAHTGRLGSYTEYAARRGFLALVAVNAGGAGQWVAPYGATAGRLSTNPISLAAPNDGGDPIVLDMATSVVPEGRIRAALQVGAAIPPEWVVAADGTPTRDPAALYGPPRGAILPFGGHKGFGLAVMVELLAGALSGAGVCHSIDAPDSGTTDGVFMLAINVSALIERSLFTQFVTQISGHLKSAPRRPGTREVLLPGEREFQSRQTSQLRGVSLEESTWREILELGERANDLQ
jgi:uncharacterized oxidoreductase